MKTKNPHLSSSANASSSPEKNKTKKIELKSPPLKKSETTPKRQTSPLAKTKKTSLKKEVLKNSPEEFLANKTSPTKEEHLLAISKATGASLDYLNTLSQDKLARLYCNLILEDKISLSKTPLTKDISLKDDFLIVVQNLLRSLDGLGDDIKKLNEKDRLSFAIKVLETLSKL